MEAVSFDIFWESYDRKVGKKRALAKWNRMSVADRRAAIAGIGRMKAYYDAKGYDLPHPSTYLNGEKWNDEYPALTPKATAATATAPVALPSGCRMATASELEALAAFKAALRGKEPAKAVMAERFLLFVAALTIPYVTEQTGVVHLAVGVNGKYDRITENMVDYYDSYADFYHLIGQYFVRERVTFCI